MSEPATRLRLRDVRAIFRLVGEVRELGDDPDRWRPHMVACLRGVVGASIVVSSEVHLRRSRAADGTVAYRVIDIGWISEDGFDVRKLHTERDDEDPEQFWLAASGEMPGAGSSENVAADAAGGQPVSVKPTRPVYGGSSFILSQYPLRHAGAVDQLGVHRAWGDEPFTHAQHRLVRVLHLELGRLWQRDALRRAKDPAAVLPPRLSQTLAALLEGKSEKEIAHLLALSRHTIHNYVKALHQRFGVSSRGELLARAGKDKTGFTPQLSLDPPKSS